MVFPAPACGDEFVITNTWLHFSTFLEPPLQIPFLSVLMPYTRLSTDQILLDQVVPTVERLCSKLSPPAPAADGASAGRGAGAEPGAGAAPLPTEFRWVAIPLGMLIQAGTFAHRRKLLHRIVKCDLGLGIDAARGGGEGRSGFGSLTHMEEAWVARVLLPALDQVGWHT